MWDEQWLHRLPGAIAKKIGDCASHNRPRRASQRKVKRAVECSQRKSDKEQEDRRGKEPGLDQCDDKKNPNRAWSRAPMQNLVQEPFVVAPRATFRSGQIVKRFRHSPSIPGPGGGREVGLRRQMLLDADAIKSLSANAGNGDQPWASLPAATSASPFEVAPTGAKFFRLSIPPPWRS